MASIQAYIDRIVGYRVGAAASLMILLGDRLGLYGAMQRLGPATPEAIAAEAGGLEPRWVLEWLRSQLCAGVVLYRAKNLFILPAEAAAVLAPDSGADASRVGLFASLGVQRLDVVEHAFRSGEVDETAFGHVDQVEAGDRARAPWVNSFLLDVVLSGIPELRSRLEAGAIVADLCCGGGLISVGIASRFPDVHVHAYDTSDAAISLLCQRALEQGLRNVTAHREDAASVRSDGPFDVVLTLDCMHEMPDPGAIARAIADGLSPDGVWFIEDFRAPTSPEQDADWGSLGTLLFANSVLSCLALSVRGAALGAAGFTEAFAREIAENAGLTRFTSYEFENPAYVHYLAAR